MIIAKTTLVMRHLTRKPIQNPTMFIPHTKTKKQPSGIEMKKIEQIWIVAANFCLPRPLKIPT
jgi:hypothetical protein